MCDKVIDFPQYRKLSNDKVFYRIRSDREFDEIQIIGNTAHFYTTKAVQYPEILRIQDMLQQSVEGFVASSEVEFNRLLNDYSLV